VPFAYHKGWGEDFVVNRANAFVIQKDLDMFTQDVENKFHNWNSFKVHQMCLLIKERFIVL